MDKAKIHPLKTLPEFFDAVGVTKTFEVRKNDRNFRVNDILWLQEWSEENGYTGRDKRYTVSYILEGEQWGIKEGYCIMGLKQFYATRQAELIDNIFSEVIKYDRVTR